MHPIKINLEDNKIEKIIEDEVNRQQNSLELIASENIVSKAVLLATGSVLTNKYAEGYPKKRYYGGCQYVDAIEELAMERACQLFDAKFVNVQPHSGSQANQAVYLALLKPGDKVLGMALDCGGHLTHGSKANQSGKWFNAVHYGVDQETHLINYDEVEKIALEEKPKMIIAGCSAYSRFIDFRRFRDIADKIGAYLLADIAHYAGLIAAKLYPNPLAHAHVITSTTHKTLRGPRGGMILTNYEDINKKIRSAVFPGLQGGPLMHVIAAKAVAFGEALTEEFVQYSKQVINNAQILAKQLKNRGYDIVSGGTDTHLLLVDLRNKGITGLIAEKTLESFNIACNKNTVPYDNVGPTITSGIRIGTPACTTRGFNTDDFIEVADIIADILDHTLEKRIEDTEFNIKFAKKINSKIFNLCEKFPIYS